MRTCSESATSWANGSTSGLRFAFLAPMGLGPVHTQALDEHQHMQMTFTSKSKAACAAGSRASGNAIRTGASCKSHTPPMLRLLKKP